MELSLYIYVYKIRPSGPELDCHLRCTAQCRYIALLDEYLELGTDEVIQKEGVSTQPPFTHQQ